MYRNDNKFFPDPKPEKKDKKKPNPIPRRTKKRAKQEREYLKERKVFLEKNPICFVKGCGKPATTIEHTKGRVGKLLLNQKYWQPCCLECNLKFETHTKWAFDNGYRVKRTE